MATQPEKKVSNGQPRKVIRRKRKPQSDMSKSFSVAWEYILHEVLIPEARDTLANALHAGTDSIVYGGEETVPRRRARGRGRNQRVSKSATYVSYDKITKPNRRERPTEERMVRSTARSDEYDEIILPTRDEAEETITALYDLIDNYEVATVADLYSYVGAPTKHTDEKWGWYDLRGASVKRTRKGYLIDLPSPEWIEWNK